MPIGGKLENTMSWQNAAINRHFGEVFIWGADHSQQRTQNLKTIAANYAVKRKQVRLSDGVGSTKWVYMMRIIGDQVWFGNTSNIDKPFDEGCDSEEEGACSSGSKIVDFRCSYD